MKAGRNESCPCGSGLKYKRCCLVKEGIVRQESAARNEAARERADMRRAALDALTAFSIQQRFARHVGAALRAFGLDEPLADAAAAADIELKFYFYWHFDARLAGGKTIAETFLESQGRSLPPRQQALLRRIAAARVRLYEVEEVRRDEGMRFVDLRSGQAMWVREQSATHQIERWDVLAARVVAEEDGVLEMEGAAYLFPSALKPALVTALRKEERSLRRRRGVVDDDALFRRFALVAHHLWLDRVVSPPAPLVVTAEGDPMLFGKSVFDIVDEDALRDALDRHPDIMAGPDGGYDWVEDSREGLTRALGNISIRGRRLTLEVTSRQRSDRGRALIEAAGGASIRHRATRYESVESAMRGAPRGSEPPESPVPSAEAARVLADYKDRHYRAWPDMPLPALDGRTPRDAARLKRFRPRLVDLLKEMENHEARAAKDESPPYDFGWIWRELGLGPPTY